MHPQLADTGNQAAMIAADFIPLSATLTARAPGAAALRNELERRRKLAEAAQQRASARQVVVVINPCNGVQCAVKLERASAEAAPPPVPRPPPPRPLPREPAGFVRPEPVHRVLYLW